MIPETEEQVVLVDREDREVGAMPKLKAHELGVLHRAFSIFLFDTDGNVMLQQRAAGKYHSALLWTNACCSHPRPGEPISDAAVRRLQEELGMDCPVSWLFSFTYRTEFDGGLVEHEIDHVFYGTTDKKPVLNADEVAGIRYAAPAQVLEEMERHPEEFTSWFRISARRVFEELDLI